MPLLSRLATSSAVAWAYLVGHGGFCLASPRLPAHPPEPDHWPSVGVVVPAREEAAVLPETLPTLLAQDYPGELAVWLVDDGSTDGTGSLARTLADQARGRASLTVPTAPPPPPGWTGKLNAVQHGVESASAAQVEFLQRRPYPHLADLWTMVTRSAYTPAAPLTGAPRRHARRAGEALAGAGCRRVRRMGGDDRYPGAGTAALRSLAASRARPVPGRRALCRHDSGLSAPPRHRSRWRLERSARPTGSSRCALGGAGHDRFTAADCRSVALRGGLIQERFAELVAPVPDGVQRRGAGVRGGGVRRQAESCRC